MGLGNSAWYVVSYKLLYRIKPLIENETRHGFCQITSDYLYVDKVSATVLDYLENSKFK